MRQSLTLEVPAASGVGRKIHLRVCEDFWVPGLGSFFCPGNMVCVSNAGQIELGLMVWERGWEVSSERRHSINKSIEVGSLFII